MGRTVSLSESSGRLDGAVRDARSDSQDHLSELEPSEALDALDSRPEGLTAAEAAERQARYGKNTITAERKTPIVLVFLAEFVSLMAWLLWFGGLVAFFAGQPQLGLAIWAVNVINGVFSFWQEYRAERATAELKKMLSSSPAWSGTVASCRSCRMILSPVT